MSPRPSIGGSGVTPQVTVRLSPEDRDDGKWAAGVLSTTQAAAMREANAALIARAEAESGEVRPSRRRVVGTDVGTAG